MSDTTTVKQKQGHVAKRTTGFVQVRLTGPIGCHA